MLCDNCHRPLAELISEVLICGFCLLSFSDHQHPHIPLERVPVQFNLSRPIQTASVSNSATSRILYGGITLNWPYDSG